jgi:hypothetical protein
VTTGFTAEDAEAQRAAEDYMKRDLKMRKHFIS